jgi:DNA processing protein
MADNPIEPPRPSGDTRLIGYFDFDFPSGLKEIKSPPAILWVRGTVPEGNLAAVVGTRNPTKSGALITQETVSFLVAHDYGIVSGLAKGVDTFAHEQALISGGKTWAYLGSGVDVPSPAENCDLAEQIVAAGGGLLSEVSLGERPSSHSLVARNRLQSGSSRFTVIAQSGIPSGTLHTALFTLEQKRPLVVVIPPEKELDNPVWAGNKALLDPDGCDPKILNAKGKLAERIVQRRPVADCTISKTSDLNQIIRTSHQ